jgi:malate synthase
VRDGHDGTWVAHPGLVPLAREAFDAEMKGPNQLERKREDLTVQAKELIRVPEGTRTEAGLRQNINVGLQYLEAWLGGTGCVPLYNLMEDAATAEISRAQLWQWIHHGALLEDSRKITRELFRSVLEEELQKVRTEVGPERFDQGHFDEARVLFEQLCLAPTLEDFLTVPAYEVLTQEER